MGYAVKLGCLGAFGSGQRDRQSAISTLANRGNELDGAEEGNFELGRGALRTALREDVDLLMTMRAGEVAHVLDDAENFDVNLGEHLKSFAGVLQADIAGRRDDDGACKRDRLNQRDDHVTGAGRQIDDEVIELAPFDLLQELADDLVQHRSTHHEWLVARRDVADGDGLDAVRVVGLDLVISANTGRLRRAHHQWDIGSVDIGVDEADAVAELGKRDGEVDSDGGFADAAFAGSDGNNFRYAGKRQWLAVRRLNEP